MNFNEIQSINNLKIGKQKDFQFRFFEQNNQAEKSSLLIGYGHNGSGKTTIGKVFSDINTYLKEGVSNNIDDLEVTLKGESQSRKVTDYFKGNVDSYINVFSRYFMEENIELHDDGNLDAIIMFGGEALDYRKIKESNEKIEELVEWKKKLEDAKTETSNEIYNIVQSIEKDYIKNILNNGKSRPVNSMKDKYKHRLSSEEINRNKISKEQLDAGLEEVKRYKEKEQRQQISFSFPDIEFIEPDDNILFTQVPSPTLSDNEQEIVDLIKEESGYTSWLNKGRDMLSKVNEQCPFCFSSIDKDLLIHKVEAILNPKAKEVRDTIKIEIDNIKEYKKELKDKEQQVFKANEYKGIIQGIDTYVTYTNKSIRNLENKLDELLNLFEAKYNNIYTELNREEFDSILSDINNETSIIKEQRRNIKLNLESYNEAIKQSKQYMEYVKNENFKLAEDYVLQKIKPLVEDETKKQCDINEYNRQINDHKGTVDQLRSKSRNLKHSMNLINRELNFIFTSNKMQLELEDHDEYEDIQGYKILVNGYPVKLDKLSTGEYNILSLIYFFKILNAEKEIAKENEDSQLIILDDPVSSLDENNIVGIISYIKSEIDNIRRNKNSKVVLFTHRWFVLNSLQKLFNQSHLTFELERKDSKTVQRFKGKKEKISGYDKLLHDIYDYANSSLDDMDHTIGNMLRRSMEAYFTFNYKMGFEKALNNEEFIEKLRSKDEVSSEFINAFIRKADKLILHSESHFEDSVKNIGREFEYIGFSKEEKQQLSKGWISLLYLLDDLHLKGQFSDTEDEWKSKQKNIAKWIDELLEYNALAI